MLNKLARLVTLILIALHLRPVQRDIPTAEDLEDIESLRDTLGDALRADGTIDFARLDELTMPVILDDLARFSTSF